VNPAPGLHIGDLDTASYSDKKFWIAYVTITVHDENHQPVEGATVSGVWSGQVVNPDCTTSSNGQCLLSKDGIRKNTSSVTFTVNEVIYNSNAYQSSDNHDPDGDSDGSVIVVYKP
jgi:hypothetical protein